MTSASDWRKSSHSKQSNCVEFRRSSRCQSGECAEVAVCRCGAQVRDSKDPDGPHLTFTPDEWHAFIGGVRNGEFDDFGT